MVNEADTRARRQDSLGPALVTLAALLWALDAPFRKFLAVGISSTVIVLLEHLLVSLCVLPLLLPRLAELRALRWQEWLAILFVGFGGSAAATVLLISKTIDIEDSGFSFRGNGRPMTLTGLTGDDDDDDDDRL